MPFLHRVFFFCSVSAFSFITSTLSIVSLLMPICLPKISFILPLLPPFFLGIRYSLLFLFLLLLPSSCCSKSDRGITRSDCCCSSLSLLLFSSSSFFFSNILIFSKTTFPSWYVFSCLRTRFDHLEK
jgi:hypothetical protein